MVRLHIQYFLFLTKVLLFYRKSKPFVLGFEVFCNHDQSQNFALCPPSRASTKQNANKDLDRCPKLAMQLVYMQLVKFLGWIELNTSAVIKRPLWIISFMTMP